MGKKIVRLTESDLVNIVKKVISEQALLKKIIGNSADDLVKVASRESVESFEKAFIKAMNNPKTFKATSQGNMLLSASGKEIPVADIERALTAIAQGKATVEQMSKYMPSQLADGSEFRSVFLSMKPKVSQKEIPTYAPKLTSGTPEYNKYHNLPSNWKGTKEGYHEKMTGKKFYIGSN
jgi:hypothetical protein